MNIKRKQLTPIFLILFNLSAYGVYGQGIYLHIQDIPADQLNFDELTSAEIGQLSNSQKQAITTNQISDHLDKIPNLVEFPAAAKAIEYHYGISADFSEAESVAIEGLVLKSNFGKRQSIDLIGKGGWEIQISAKGEVIVKAPNSISEVNLAPGDFFIIEGEKEFKTSDGRSLTVQGVYFKDRQVQVLSTVARI